MKTIKKIIPVCVALLVIVALAISGVFTSDNKIDDTVKNNLISNAENATNILISMSDTDMENYLKSGDEFTINAVQAWQASKDELGDQKKEDESKEKGKKSAEPKVTQKGNQYTVTLPVEFEKADANFVYIFESTDIPTSLTVSVQYSMGKTLQRAGLNTLMGIGTVFVMLILLSLLISLFRFIPNPEAKKAAEAKAAKVAKEAEAAAIAQTAPAQAEENLADDGELVAVIAAAIAAAEGTTTDGFVVRSIRKVKRNRR